MSLTRRFDALGRITIPIEIRRNLNMNVGDAVEIFIDEEQIILKKYVEKDIFDGSTEDLVEYKGKLVSKNTIKELVNLITE